MKKDAVGRMAGEKEGFGTWFKKSDILPFVFCVLLAVILWLVYHGVTEVQKNSKTDTVETEIVSLINSEKK